MGSKRFLVRWLNEASYNILPLTLWSSVFLCLLNGQKPDVLKIPHGGVTFRLCAHDCAKPVLELREDGTVFRWL